MIDTNLYDERIFHTSMLLNEIDLDNYLFNIDAADLNKKTKKRIIDMLEKEMQEIFYARNFK
jgi:S-adenosylmethionine decarboxylase